jgi:hypothetical protein
MPSRVDIKLAIRSSLAPLAHKVIEASYGLVHKRILHLHRTALAKEIFRDHGGNIAYGPFAGLKIATSEEHVNPDFPAMYFGLYEKEVLDALMRLPRDKNIFINLGAGDGYYPIGVLINNLCERSVAYEMDLSRQNVIRNLSDINGVSSLLEIRGFAAPNFYQDFTPQELGGAVIFSDIEGGEFDIFTLEAFSALQNSTLIIELHTQLVKNGDARLKVMRDSANKYFDIEEFSTGARDLSPYPELQNYPDVDRWFMAVEGRGPLMTWWILTPRKS